VQVGDGVVLAVRLRPPCQQILSQFLGQVSGHLPSVPPV
jgi:hypothetical protein